MKRLSLLMIAKNAEELLNKSLESTEGLVDEIIIVDNGSTDKTVDIAKKYKAHIYTNSDKDLGKLREYGFEKTTGDWVLMLDADEVLSQELKNEIASFKRSPEAVTKHTGYVIPYTNHFLGRPLKYGGENYKILRLFKRDMVKIDSALLHEKFEVTQGTVGELNHPIYHYSYRSLAQVYKKFTDYALRDARQRKQKGEKTSLKKIFLYPIHMFWARYIEDKGYKDGLFRIPLDLGFAYMEWLTYFYMALHTYYKKYALISILFIFLFKNLFIIFSIPPWEAPDEPGHVSYVIYMYNNKSFPSATQPFVLQSINESFKKNRILLRNIQKHIITGDRLELFKRDQPKYSESANLGSHPPLYYIYLLPYYAMSLFFSSYMTLVLLRVGSLVLGLITLLLTYKICMVIFAGSKKMSIFTVFLLSFHPMFSFMSSVVNNDSMVVTAFMLFIYTMLKAMQNKNSSISYWFYAAVVAGLSPLVKPQLLVLPIIFMGFAFVVRKRLPSLFSVSIVSFVPAAIWIFYQYMLEGTKMVTYPVQSIQKTHANLLFYPLDFILSKQPVGIFMSTWGFFGWLDLPMPKITYVFYIFFVIVSILGLVQYLRLSRMKHVCSIRNVFLIISTIAYILVIFIFDVQTYYLAHKFVIHGRYFLPVIPLLFMSCVWGLSFYINRFKKALLLITICIFIYGQIVMIITINKTYYTYILPRNLFSVYSLY